jgi:O-antigen/teichoic acid export membrane protein
LRLRLPAILGGGLWALVAKLVSQAAQLAAFIIAARILTPAQFGFFAFSSAVAIFLVVLAEGGWAEFVMKSQQERRLDQIAAISLASGLLFTVLGLSIVGTLYGVFDKVWEASLLALFCCWILPSAMTTVYDGVLVRRGELRRKAVIRIAAELIGLVVTVLGLAAGWNVFALVLGRLAMQVLILAGSIGAVGWVPFAIPARGVLKEVLQFSRHVLAIRLIMFLRSYSGTLAVGSFLGLAEAGFYRAAERIVAAITELVGEPARMLAWILLRRARDSEQPEKDGADAVASLANAFLPLLFLVAAPIYLGLALVAGNFVDVVLGDVWAPAAMVTGILALKQLLLVGSYVTEPLLSIKGGIHRVAQVGLANTVISVGFVVSFAPFGLLPVAYGQMLAAIIAFASIVWLHERYGRLDWLQVVNNSAFVLVAILSMVSAVVAISYVSEMAGLVPSAALALQVGAGMLGYAGALLVMKKFVFGLMPVLVAGQAEAVETGKAAEDGAGAAQLGVQTRQ